MKSARSAVQYAPAEMHAPLRGFEMRRVTTRAEWCDARTIRYEALAARGDIEPDDERSYADPHDEALNAITFILSRNGEAVAATRSSVSSARRRWPLPAMEAFAPELQSAVSADATIVEASLMAVSPAAPLDAKAALFHLFKAHMLHCAAESADWLVVAVRDSQIGFYRRMFNMEILSGAEPYPGMASPRVLMGLEYRKHAPLLFKRIPVLAVTDADERDFMASGVITFADARRGAMGRREAALNLAADQA